MPTPYLTHGSNQLEPTRSFPTVIIAVAVFTLHSILSCVAVSQGAAGDEAMEKADAALSMVEDKEERESNWDLTIAMLRTKGGNFIMLTFAESSQ